MIYGPDTVIFDEKIEKTDLNFTEVLLWISNWFVNSVILLKREKV